MRGMLGWRPGRRRCSRAEERLWRGSWPGFCHAPGSSGPQHPARQPMVGGEASSTVLRKPAGKRRPLLETATGFRRAARSLIGSSLGTMKLAAEPGPTRPRSLRLSASIAVDVAAATADQLSRPHSWCRVISTCMEPNGSVCTPASEPAMRRTPSAIASLTDSWAAARPNALSQRMLRHHWRAGSWRWRASDARRSASGSITRHAPKMRGAPRNRLPRRHNHAQVCRRRTSSRIRLNRGQSWRGF